MIKSLLDIPSKNSSLPAILVRYERYFSESQAEIVKKAKENPYFTLFEENSEGFLNKSKIGNYERRQDCPEVYAFNGSMYLINIESIKKSRIAALKRIKKIIMPEERSVDIDTLADWALAEYYLKNENSQNYT